MLNTIKELISSFSAEEWRELWIQLYLHLLFKFFIDVKEDWKAQL